MNKKSTEEICACCPIKKTASGLECLWCGWLRSKGVIWYEEEKK